MSDSEGGKGRKGKSKGKGTDQGKGAESWAKEKAREQLHELQNSMWHMDKAIEAGKGNKILLHARQRQQEDIDWWRHEVRECEPPASRLRHVNMGTKRLQWQHNKSQTNMQWFQNAIEKMQKA